MNLNKAMICVGEGVNLEAAKRTIIATRKTCDNLLDSIDRQIREQHKEEARKRKEAFDKNPEEARFACAVREAYLEAFRDVSISHWFAFMERLTYDNIELKLTEQQYNKIRKENKGDLAAQLDEIIKCKL